MDAGIRAPQVPTEMLGQGLDGCLGRIVRRVARRVCDALLASCDDDSRGLGLGGFLDYGQE
jgi:hypothetical protein